MTSLVLMVAAFVLLLLAALGVNVPRVNAQAAGLACWVLALLLQGHAP